MGGAETRNWTRTTEWRQGHVLTADACSALGLAHANNADETCVVVVGHDCDVANDNLEAEPDVELIVGRVVNVAAAAYTRTKNPRRLHLELEKNDARVAIELDATAKRFVPKVQLAPWAPDLRFRLDPTGLETLRHWLSLRYKRAAFPDEFDRRLREVTGLAARIEKIVRRFDAIVSGVYFRLDRLDELDADDATPYILEIVLAYEPGLEPEANGDQADDAANSIRDAFKERCWDADKNAWQYLRLKDAIAISEDDMTISQAKRLQQWRLEHLSLRPDADSADPIGLKA